MKILPLETLFQGYRPSVSNYIASRKLLSRKIRYIFTDVKDRN